MAVRNEEEHPSPPTEDLTYVGRSSRPADSVVDVGGRAVGGGRLTVFAGPCAVESRDQLFAVAELVVAAGADVLRGDAFKPRTSPYSFQGLGEKALEMLAEVRDELDVPFVAEVLDTRDVDLVGSYADMIRIGARNMDNYPLLTEVGRQSKPVMLKRGHTASIAEWLSSAEYIYKEGNEGVVLCERGIRTFEDSTRNTLDISAVPVVREASHLPVVVDPSHASGRRALVPPLARAAVAAGAHGVMIDVHTDPSSAMVDGAQALLPEDFELLAAELRRLSQLVAP